jgi:hypothetical protein
MFRANAARTGEMPGPGPDDANGVEATWTFAPGMAIAASPAVVAGSGERDRWTLVARYQLLLLFVERDWPHHIGDAVEAMHRTPDDAGFQAEVAVSRLVEVEG